jgi:hypothetical protein
MGGQTQEHTASNQRLFFIVQGLLAGTHSATVPPRDLVSTDADFFSRATSSPSTFNVAPYTSPSCRFAV